MLKADNLPPSCAVVIKSVNLNFLESSGDLRACNGTTLPLPKSRSVVNILASGVYNFNILTSYHKILQKGLKDVAELYRKRQDIFNNQPRCNWVGFLFLRLAS